MANTQSMCTTFMEELLTATHDFTPSTGDTFYGALLLASSTFNASSTAYTGTVGSVTMSGEVSGTNYNAGGVAVTNATAPNSTNTSSTAGVAYWTPSASLVYTNVTLSTAFDALMLYNYTKGTGGDYPAVSIHTFGSQTVTAGTFTLTMPTNNTTNALIRLATT